MGTAGDHELGSWEDGWVWRAADGWAAQHEHVSDACRPRTHTPPTPLPSTPATLGCACGGLSAPVAHVGAQALCTIHAHDEPQLERPAGPEVVCSGSGVSSTGEQPCKQLSSMHCCRLQ